MHIPMSHDQEAHLAAIKKEFCELTDVKYRKGQAEHGGNVWERRTVNDMEGEVADFFVYFKCIRDDFKRINLLVTEARTALNCGNMAKGQKCLDEIYHLTKIDPH